MPELQTVIDFSIQINKFINIDLFQRGYYQLRLALKLPNCKLPNKIELQHRNLKSFLRSNVDNNSSFGGLIEFMKTNGTENNTAMVVLPSCIINGVSVSKTFQINYKNEEINLNDTVSYRVTICLDIIDCIKQIQKTNIILDVELWYSDQECLPNPYDSLSCVSSRQLKIHFDLCRGIHHHLPVIFDYFHLSAVTLSIHGCLVTLGRPYICKTSNTNNDSSLSSTGAGWLSNFIKTDHQMKNGERNDNDNGGGGKKTIIDDAVAFQLFRLQLAQWKLVSIILLSLFNLKKIIDECYRVLPPWQQAKINYEKLFVKIPIENLSNLSQQCLKEIGDHSNNVNENNIDDLSALITKFQENLHQYIEKNENNLEYPKLEDAFNMLEHDLALICGYTIEQWYKFLLLTTGAERINQHFAKIHHFQRIKRFSEAFFCIENPRSNLNSLCDQNSNIFLELSEFLRKSAYFTNLPPCDVECVHLDGDSNTLPIIFEEKYEHFIEPKLKLETTNHHHSPSKLSLSSSTTTTTTSSSNNNSPKSSNIRSLLSRLNSDRRKDNHHHPPKSTSSPTQIDKVKNTELKTLELFELYKAEIFPVTSGEKCDPGDFNQMMNRKIKLLNAFLNQKNLLKKSYSNLGIIQPSSYMFNRNKTDKQIEKNTNERNNRQLENSQSWPDISTDVIGGVDSVADSTTYVTNTDPEVIKKKNHKKHHHHLKKNHSDKTSTTNNVEVFPVMNYRNFSGTMYFPKPPKEFAMEEIDEPAQEISMKPIPKISRSGSREQKIIPEPSIIDLKHLSLTETTSDASGKHTGLHLDKQHQINNSLSYQDLTKIDQGKTRKNRSSSKARDDIYLKSNNLNETKFTFMELLQSDHCLICCGSIEKRVAAVVTNNHQESWPCKCKKKTGENKVSQQQKQRSPERTAPSFRRVSAFDSELVSFLHEKETFRNNVATKVKNLMFYSDFHMLASRIPYFQCENDFKSFKDLHLIVCVHGLDGNSADLRLVKTYLELGLPTNNFEFLMSQRNQGETFDSLDTLTGRLINEIDNYVSSYKLNPTRISFIGHSLGNIIIRAAISHQDFLKRWRDRFHTFLSLSGPHLGLAYNRSGLVNMGLWFIQKFKRAPSLNQLSMKDATDIRQTFLYRLSCRPGLEYFRNVLLCGSSQDYYVPIHSAHIELCTAAIGDSSDYGIAYREMTENILQRLMARTELNVIRYDVHHALTGNPTNSLIGRAAHIAVLDSELFIEKFMMVVGLKYFV